MFQPYRTNPLVLPGAKVKKDYGPTESYLRHHPNPMFRQAPPHPLMSHDIAMKQKVSYLLIIVTVLLDEKYHVIDQNKYHSLANIT